MTTFRQIAEKRLEKRWLVDKQGYLLRTESTSREACRVLDWSARGAKIEVKDSLDAPYQFTLVIDFGKSIMGAARCHKIWTAGSTIGVQFEEELYFDIETNESVQP